MAKNNNKYPHFVENQVLRSSTLNDSFAFVDEQTRLSRVHLFGTGIVEGLGFSAYGNSLVINPGVAVDKDGWLVQFEEKTGYYYASYVSDSEAGYESDSLEKILNEGGSHVEMVCFKTEDDAKELGLHPVPMSDVDIKKYVVAIAFGKRNELSTKCSHDRCDINVVKEILEPWPVLIPQTAIQALYKKIEPVNYVVLPQSGPSLQNYHGDSSLFNKQVNASCKAWSLEIDNAIGRLLDDILLKDSKGGKVSIWKSVIGDCTDLINRLNLAKTRIQALGSSAAQTVPDYYLSFFGDMSLALNEFFEVYNEFAGKYKVVPNVIPSDRLIYLGSASGACGNDVYSSLFKGAIDPAYQQDCVKLQKMLTRICVLSECFIGNVSESQLASYPFGLQMIRSGASLSRRPVPFYYETERVANFNEVWTADMLYPAADVDGKVSGNSVIEDGCSLYPVGYQKKSWSVVRNDLLRFSQDLRLSIDVAEAGIKSVRKLSMDNLRSLVNFFKQFEQMEPKSLADNLDAIKKDMSGLAGKFAGFIKDIVTSNTFVRDLGEGCFSYSGSYHNLTRLAQIKEPEVWKVVEKITEWKKFSYPAASDKKAIYNAFCELIQVCSDSFFANAEERKPEGMERVVFMGPVKRGSKVYLFTQSHNGMYDESTPRTVVSYGVDYINPELTEEEEYTYSFKLALSKSEGGRKIADIPETVSPYDEDRWKVEEDGSSGTITIYPFVDGPSKHLYSTDISNIEAVVSPSGIMSAKIRETGDIENCIPAVDIIMVKNGSSKVTLTLKDADGNVLTTKQFTVSVNNAKWTIHRVTGISLSEKTLSGFVGQTSQLVANISPANATNKSVTWKSSNSFVAKVDQNGNVTYTGSGNAKITATTADGGKVASTDVKVTSLDFRILRSKGDDKDFPEVVNPYSDLDRWENHGEVLEVYPYCNDGSAWKRLQTSDSNILYEISSSDLLSVRIVARESGTPAILIKMLKNGTSRVSLKIKSDDGTVLYTRTFTVNVNNPEWNIVHVTGVSLPSHLSIYVGQHGQLTAMVEPKNATNQKLTWQSEPLSLVVDPSGNYMVKGSSAVKGRIKVTTTDGSFTASSEVVAKSIDLMTADRNAKYQSVSDSLSPYQSNLVQSYDMMWFCPFESDGTTPQFLQCESMIFTVKSSSEDVAYCCSKDPIMKNGIKVPFFKLQMKKNGSTKITVELRDNNNTLLLSKAFTVVVNNPEWNKVPVTSVSFPYSSKKIFVGQTIQLSATINPSNASDLRLAWSSSSSSIASVNSSTGSLTGIAAGITSIKATSAQDKTKSASLSVQVSSIHFEVLDVRTLKSTVVSSLNKLSLADNCMIIPYIDDGTTKKRILSDDDYSIEGEGFVTITMDKLIHTARYSSKPGSSFSKLTSAAAKEVFTNFLPASYEQKCQVLIPTALDVKIKIKDTNTNVLYSASHKLKNL